MMIDISTFESLSKKEAVSFEFLVSQDDIRNSNDIGFAKTWRQQCYLNRQRNEKKRHLVQMGIDAAASYDGKKMTKAFLIVEVSNRTNHRFDPPNFELTMKDIEDGLVKGGVIEDDNSDVIVGTLFVAGEKKDRDNYMIRLTFYDLGGDKDANNGVFREDVHC